MMFKEEVLGFLVVIIAIADCVYLLYIYKSTYQWPLHKRYLNILETKRTHGIEWTFIMSKGIHNNNNGKSFLELLLWGQPWLVYWYRYICIITTLHQWCLWLSCQAEELRLLCWANHLPKLWSGSAGLNYSSPMNSTELRANKTFMSSLMHRQNLLRV